MKTRFFIWVIFLFMTIPLSTSAQENIGQLIINRQYEKALQEIDRDLSKVYDPNLVKLKGQIYAGMQDYPQAIRYLQESLNALPNEANIHAELAEAHSALGNVPDAISHYRQALRKDQGSLLYKSKLGQLLLSQREFTEAYALFGLIREVDSTNLLNNKYLAVAAARTNHSDEAIELLEEVLEINPRDIGSYMSLSGLYNQDKKYTRANDVISRGLEQFPGNNSLLLRLAQNLYNQHNFADALPVYEEWLQTNALYFDVRKEYGITLYLNKQEDKALQILEPALEEVPNDPYVALYIGLCHKKLKDFDTSQGYLELAIESSTPPYLSDIYHHLGQVHGLKREFELSIQMLLKAYELDPENYELLFEIATTYEEYNANKTMALNYYQLYLTEAKEKARNPNYALDRITRIKEELFFEE
jgi:tetratricopeptide (TPR) repeat protein